ncbi:MAG: hypothetical protein NTW84_07080 [Methanothrix sp.]|nr:hypothetical protein [Methanothrix sp.]
MDCYEMGDTLNGAKIYVEARKVDGPRVIVKTGRHRAQSITAIENAKAVIVKKLKYAYKDEDNSEKTP